MNIETLIQNATTDELRVIAQIAERARNKPAILATVGKRRYVVAQEDEHVFDGFVPGENVQGMSGMVSFGCQWMRSYGKVDEMYRTLSLWEVTKVQRVDRAKVWGSDTVPTR